MHQKVENHHQWRIIIFEARLQWFNSNKGRSCLHWPVWNSSGQNHRWTKCFWKLKLLKNHLPPVQNIKSIDSLNLIFQWTGLDPAGPRWFPGMILDAYPDLNNNTIRWLGLTLYLHNIAIDISLPAWNQQHLWTLSTLMETSNPPLLRSGCGRNVFSWDEMWNRMWWTFEYIKICSPHSGSNSNFQCRSYMTLLHK